MKSPIVQDFDALIIEDDRMQGDIFFKALTTAGYLPKIIDDGNEAIQFLISNLSKIEFILLDLGMPGAGGDEILNVISTKNLYLKTIVILATANVNLAFEIREKVELSLLKPISYTQLVSIAKRYKAFNE